MKHVKLFEEFSNDENNELNEGFKEWALAGALTLGTITNMFGAGKQAADTRWHKEVTSKEQVMKNINKGWQLDSQKIQTILDTVNINSPTEVIKVEVDLSKGFVLGGYTLSPESKSTIDSMFSVLSEQGMIVSGIKIESSTDKVPIVKGGELEKSGIKTNKDLSNARTNSIIDYLKDKDYVNADTASKIVKDVQWEKGRDINLSDANDLKTGDSTARYVKLSVQVLSQNPSLTTEIRQKIEEKYYLSKESKPGTTTEQHKPNIKVKKYKVDKSHGHIKCPGI